MAHSFDQDPSGAVLEFGLLMREGHHLATPERRAWEAANLRRAHHQTWVGPALSKGHLISVLEGGRQREDVRRRLDRVFLRLEADHLIEPFSRDDNLVTQYRVVSPLGEELLHQNAHREYLGGLTTVVQRWRRSVVKIYHPTEAGIGTGFLVRPDVVATARHVVDGLDELEIALEDGTVLPHTDIVRPTNLPELDLALIRLAEPLNEPRPFRLSVGPELLDEVVVFGYPPVPSTDGAYLVVNRGEVSSEVALYASQLHVLVVSCLLRGGNSGGPVVNRRGHVIGVVSRNLFAQLSPDEKSINEGLGFAAALTSEWLQDLLDGKV